MQLRCIACFRYGASNGWWTARRYQFSRTFLLSNPQSSRTPILNPHAGIPSRQRRFYAGIKSLQTQDARANGLPQRNSDAIRAELARALEVLDTSSAPPENALIVSLRICEHLASNIVEPSEPPEPASKPSKPTTTATSNLLALEVHAAKQSSSKRVSKAHAQGALRDEVSSTAYRIVTDPKVFLTSRLLSLYINVQSLLRRPQTFPEIFDLYATKPIPRAGSSPITYTQQNPESAKAAIPLQIASTALDAALRERDLALCLNIITTTVATSAFRRAKFFRKALMPSIGLGLSPAAAYVLATTYADVQDRLDPDRAMWSSMIGFMTYFTMVAVTGFAAVTTESRHHDRITWRPGTPLNRRWYREQERLFTDRVAQAWGFQDYLKRGLEEGEDWENLRAWAMTRSMDLDRTELLEHME